MNVARLNLAPTGERCELVRQEYAKTSTAASWMEAHQWDFGPEIARATAEEVRRKLMLTPQDRVLEVGTGTGGLLQMVLHEGQNGVGFDLCEALVRQGARFGVDKDRVKLGVAEAARIPFRSDSFDKVFCFSIFHHFPHDSYARVVCREMLRVCRKGGTMLIGDVCGVMERRRKLLLRLGFRATWADFLLWTFAPFVSTRQTPHQSLFYRRSFFRSTLATLPCEFVFLEPETPQRKSSNWRFDVRVQKVTKREKQIAVNHRQWVLRWFGQST